MSRGVNVSDPQRLEEFAKTLSSSSQEIEGAFQRIKGQLGQLGSSWKDGEYERFRTQLDENMKAMRSFLGSAEGHVRELRRKAKLLEQFQGR